MAGDHAVRPRHRAEDPAAERFVVGSPVPRGFREVGAFETSAADEVVATVDGDELERTRGSIPGPGRGTAGRAGHRYDVGALLEGSRRAQALAPRRPLVVVHHASLGRVAFPGVHVGLRQVAQGYGARGFRGGCLEERRDGPLRHGGSARGFGEWRARRGAGRRGAVFRQLVQILWTCRAGPFTLPNCRIQESTREAPPAQTGRALREERISIFSVSSAPPQTSSRTCPRDPSHFRFAALPPRRCRLTLATTSPAASAGPRVPRQVSSPSVFPIPGIRQLHAARAFAFVLSALFSRFCFRRLAERTRRA